MSLPLYHEGPDLEWNLPPCKDNKRQLFQTAYSQTYRTMKTMY